MFHIQVEVKAVPVSQKKAMQAENVKKLQRIPASSSASSSGTDLTFGGLPAPKLEATYEPMIVKEARYIAITMMKVRRWLKFYKQHLDELSHTLCNWYQLGSILLSRCFGC